MERIGVKIFAVDSVSPVLNKIGQKENVILQKTGQIAHAFDKVGTSAKSAGNSIGGIESKIGGLANLAKGMVAGVSVAGVIGGVKELGTAVVQTYLEMNALQEAIKFSGGAEGQKNLDFLKQTVEKYGLPLKESAEGFKVLSGAMMGTKLAGDPMRKIFEAVAQNATVMGISAEDTKGVFLALGQIMSKGKVSAEELNGQLGERLPGALGIAADAMGVTKAELLDMMQQGKLMAEDFLPKFAEQLSKTYGTEALKKTDTLQANLNRLNNRWIEFKTKLGAAIAPLLNTVLQKIMSIMDAMQPFVAEIQHLFSSIKFPDLNATPALAQLLKTVKTYIHFTIERFKMIYQIVYPVFEKIGLAIYSILPDVQGLFGDILAAVQPVADFLKEIVRSITEAVDVSGMLKSVFEILRSVVQALGNVFKILFQILEPILKPILYHAFRLLGEGIKIVLNIVKELAGWLKTVTDKIMQATNWVKKKLGLGKNEAKDKTEAGTPAEVMLAEPEKPATKTAENIFGAEKEFEKSANQADVQIQKNTQEIISGGSKPTHITINIAKFQDYIQITTNNLQQGVQDIERQLEEMLLRVVNGVNQVV
ncbi:MAG: tape measure protein [Bacteroidia bacterium]|nr:tape measure protein [Bacteroidia bacterium]